MDKLTLWLTNLISGMVSFPDQVVVTRKPEDEQGVLFVVSVSKEDTGKIIGKKGAISNALRTVLRSAGFMEDIRASLKIDAPNTGFNNTNY